METGNDPEKGPFIKIDFNDILWNVLVKPKRTDFEEKLVVLEWGWTAGMTKEELENLAEDSPKGHDFVTMDISQAKDLLVRLETVIKELEAA